MEYENSVYSPFKFLIKPKINLNGTTVWIEIIKRDDFFQM